MATASVEPPGEWPRCRALVLALGRLGYMVGRAGYVGTRGLVPGQVRFALAVKPGGGHGYDAEHPHPGHG